ncbi:MAG: hemolysin family protein [Lautropia sp.]|nr:hemolysin family protein [Lautropia sp.]
MDIAILLGLIVLNGLFAMSEVALLTARKARLQRMVAEGDKSAAAALALGEDPTQFLSTIQIGITSISVLNGIVGQAAFAPPLAQLMQDFGLAPKTADAIATAVVVMVITYVSIVIGELVPKRLGQINAESAARFAARPMGFLALISRPFVTLLTGSTNLILRSMGVDPASVQKITEEEIHALLAEGSESGVIEQNEHVMVRNVFRLDERQISSLMVPRSDVVYLDVEDAPEENLSRVAGHEHSRFPVCRGGLEDVIGIVHTKQLLAQSLRGESIDFSQSLQEVLYVPETLTGMELLENFRNSNTQIALVLDEFGEVQGLITLQDLLEAITGEFASPDDEDSWALQRDDGSWLLDGLIPIPELKDRLNLLTVPEEEKGRYQALSGMLMLLLGRMPQTGDVVVWESWKLEVVDMDGKRIDKVLATPISTEGSTTLGEAEVEAASEEREASAMAAARHPETDEAPVEDTPAGGTNGSSKAQDERAAGDKHATNV